MSVEKENKISNVYAEIYMDQGIVFGFFKGDLFLDLNAAKQIVKDRKLISNYEATIMFVDVSTVKGVSKEARDYFGSDEGSELLRATAIYTNSKLSAFLANFLLKVNLSKSNHPIKLFTEKEKALKWLESFK